MPKPKVNYQAYGLTVEVVVPAADREALDLVRDAVDRELLKTQSGLWVGSGSGNGMVDVMFAAKVQAETETLTAVRAELARHGLLGKAKATVWDASPRPGRVVLQPEGA